MGDPALTQMYNVTVNGGNEKLRFSTSLTQHNQDGIISNSGVRRTNMNTKINVKLAKNVNLLVNPRFTYRRDLGAGARRHRYRWFGGRIELQTNQWSS